MSVVKLLSSIEELAIELALWLVLIPKTMLFVAFRPSGVWPYTQGELLKAPGDRFDEYVSPVLFWVLLGPVTFLLVLKPVVNNILSQLAGPFEEQVLVAVLLLFTGPVAFALQVPSPGGTRLSRKAFTKAFSVQCYFFGVFALISNCALAVVLSSLPGRGFSSILTMGGVVIWLGWAELRFGSLHWKARRRSPRWRGNSLHRGQQP
jgi:hypothetical protein